VDSTLPVHYTCRGPHGLLSLSVIVSCAHVTSLNLTAQSAIQVIVVYCGVAVPAPLAFTVSLPVVSFPMPTTVEGAAAIATTGRPLIPSTSRLIWAALQHNKMRGPPPYGNGGGCRVEGPQALMQRDDLQASCCMLRCCPIGQHPKGTSRLLLQVPIFLMYLACTLKHG
jgi:hypothetical protein